MFWIDIENAGGDKLGSGPITSGIRWRYRQRLSRAGEWSLDVPLGEPKLSNATLGRFLHCYARNGGTVAWMGGGPLENSVVSLRTNTPPTLTLSGADPLRTFAWTTVNFAIDALHAPGSGHLVLANIVSAVPPWLFQVDGVVPEMSARFVHESALNALVSSCDKLGMMFRINPAERWKVFFRTTPDSSGLLATNLGDPVALENNPNACLITNIERQQSSWELVNRVRVYGAGDGEARLTLALATAWPDGSSVSGSYTVADIGGTNHIFVLDKATNTVRDTTSITAYGERHSAIAFKDIAPITPNDADMQAAANSLLLAAVSKLLSLSAPQEQYSLNVAGLRKPLLPGQYIRVLARKFMDGQPLIDINRQLLVLETETQIDTNGARVAGLTVSTSREYAKTDGEILMDQIQQIRAFESHPQIGPTENTLTYREDVDDDYGASFPFWLSSGTIQVNSVRLRFRLERLRSSVKAQGGSVTGTVDLPPHQHTVNIGDHDHGVVFQGDPNPTGNHPFARIVYLDVTDNPPQLYFEAAGGGADAVTSEEGGGSSPTSEAGGGGTIDLDISSAITTIYGVYEEPSPATPYGADDLAWTVNGEPVTETPQVISSGWYELDLTSYLTNPATLRPLDYANTVGVAVANPQDKRVRVTAQIELRTTIQSIAAT